MADVSCSELYRALIAVHEEIREEGSEFDFRFTLVDHLFIDALGWSRTESEGHVNFEDERKDVLCYDDSEPPFPAIVCETKRPAHDLDLDDVILREVYDLSDEDVAVVEEFLDVWYSGPGFALARAERGRPGRRIVCPE